VKFLLSLSISLSLCTTFSQIEFWMLNFKSKKRKKNSLSSL
jgi:hypothetical protein